MNIRLKLAKISVPGFMKKKILDELFLLTADAFQSEMPDLKGRSFKERLDRYARFTQGEAEKALFQGRDLQGIKNRLFQSAQSLGRKLRKSFRISTTEEVMAAARILYLAIGIDFWGNDQGEIAIRRCLFSRYYSPDVCALISSLDEGILAGLASGGELSFEQRLTEGKNSCRAKFVFKESIK